MAVGLCPAALTSVAATSAPRANTSFLAAEGKKIKVRCHDAGMQRISFETLRNWGFESPESVKVYGYDVAPLAENRLNAPMPDDLPELPFIQWPADNPECLIFYSPGAFSHTVTNNAVSTVANNYAEYACYILAESPTDAPTGQDGHAPKIVPLSFSDSEPIDFHRSLQFNKQRKFRAGEGGAFYFGDKFESPAVSLDINVEEPMTDSEITANYGPSGRFFYSLAAEPTTHNSQKFSATITSYPREMLTEVTQVAAEKQNMPVELEFLIMAGGAFDFNFVPGASAGPASFTATLGTAAKNYSGWRAIDSYGMTYLRHNVLRDTPIEMFFDFLKGESATVKIVTDKATDECIVWDVTEPDSPMELQTAPDSDGNLLAYVPESPTGAGRHVIAFMPTGRLAEPKYEREIAPQNLHGLPATDLLVITTETYRKYAEKLADYHTDAHGLACAVVTHDQVLNEYSSGTPHAMAYRRLARMLYERYSDSEGNPRLKYIMLFGPAVWDNLHTEIPEGDYLLTYNTEIEQEAALEYKCYSSNDYFGIMNPDHTTGQLLYGVLDVAVGHIDSRSENEAESVTSKLINYMENPPIDGDYYNRAIFLTDSGNSNEFVRESESRSNEIRTYNPAVTTDKIYNGLYALDRLKMSVNLNEILGKALTDGRYYWSFTGHANVEEFKSTHMMWNRSLAASSSYRVPPITMLGTCSVYGCDLPDNSIGRTLLMSGSGSIAVIAAGRPVFSNYNLQLNKTFTSALYQDAQPGWTIGDVYKHSKNRVLQIFASRPDGLANTKNYNLMGDPAMPIIAPRWRVVASEVAGTKIEPSYSNQSVGDAQADALVPFTIKGYVSTDDTGETRQDFNGKVYIAVYDGGYSTSVSDLGTKPVYATARMDETVLGRTAADVRDGEFEARITVSPALRCDTINRITFFAVSSDHKEFARGVCNALTLNPGTENPTFTDVKAPNLRVYINSPAFSNGDLVSSTRATLIAEIEEAESGIDTSTWGQTSAVAVELDGKRSLSDATLSVSGQNEYSLKYDLTNLADGNHHVTVNVTDRAGNTASQTLRFTVRNTTLDGILSVEESPAREMATFTYEPYIGLSIPREARLIVRNASGGAVASIPASTMPIEWNLKDHNGNEVPDGVYEAFLLLEDGNFYGHTASTTFIVVK